MKHEQPQPSLRLHARLPKQVAPVRRPAIASQEGSGEAALGMDASGNVKPAPLPLL